MSQANANKWIHLLHAVLNQALAQQELRPARNTDELAVMLAAKRTEDVPRSPPFWHDDTERPINRPTDPEDQQDYDSGKKKCQTIKNLLVIHETCHICFLSATYAGKAHEKSLAELEGYTLPHGSCLYQDTGFQGVILNDIIMSNRRKNRVGGNSPHLRKRPIVRSGRSESRLNTLLAV